MSETADEFYAEERWENWLDRLRDADLDPEDEDSARLLLNLQDDVAIAVAKILRSYDEGNLDAEAARGELESISDVVLAEPAFDDEETAMLVDGVQTSLVCVFYAADQYVTDGVADEADIQGYVEAAAAAESEDDLDRALGLTVCAGTRVIDGERFGVDLTEDIEYGLVTEWVDGLDSLQSALSEPEVIEDDA